MSRILVVSMGAQGAAAIVKLLLSANHEVRPVHGFGEGLRATAEYLPDLLLASVRLGRATGLDLVVAAQTTLPTMRGILIDRRYDSLIASEAKRRGVGYLVEPVPDEEMLGQVLLRLTEGTRPRRWPRRRPAHAVLAEIVNRPGRVIDLSYGGLQVELIQLNEMPSPFDVVVLSADVSFRATPVWTRRGLYGWVWCGAELADPSADALASWRRLVDSV
jgi:CheY-like chemotaxis protein